MPNLTLAPVGGMSSTGHLDPGLLMSPTLVMSGTLAMRGQGAFGDMDLMTPVALAAVSSAAVTTFVATVLTGVLPSPVNAQSQTGPLVFVAPVIPDLTASASSTILSVVAPVKMIMTSSGLSQTAILVTAMTDIGSLNSAGAAAMLFTLPFGAASTLAVSPSSSMSATSMSITALTQVAFDPVAAQSLTTILVGALANVVDTSAASLSDAEAVFAIGQLVLTDPSSSVSITTFPIPLALFNLESVGISVTDLWLRAPGRVSTRKLRGAGPRTLEMAGMVPLGG